MNGVMNMKLGRNMKSLKSMVLALTLAALVAAPGRALAVTDLVYDPQTNPVADNVTRLEMTKYEKGTDKVLSGAHMQIIEEETGRVVAEWTTGDSSELIEKKLDIDTWYILVEQQAPEGYAKAPNTRFILRSEDFNTTGYIDNPHEDVEFSVVSGSGQDQAFVINLYDRLEAVKENHVKREVKRTLPKTSDTFDPAIAGVVAVGGAAAVAAGLAMKRREK